MTKLSEYTTVEMQGFIKTGSYTILSGEAPRFPAWYTGNAILADYLTSKGYDFITVQGHYGGEEQSILIKDLPYSEARYILQAFGQDSVLIVDDYFVTLRFNKLANQNPWLANTEDAHYFLPGEELPADCYSTITTADGSLTFQFDLA